MSITTRMGTTIVSAVLLLSSATNAAQQIGSLSGPTLGYLFDRNVGKLRPLLGIPGSSTTGTPVELGFSLSQALTLGPRHVLASTDQYPELLVLDLATSPPSTMVISGAPAGPSSAAASRHGTSAAFYKDDGHSIWIVTGLPQKPAISYSIDLSLEGPVRRLAISDDGQLLVYSIVEGDREALYSWSASSDRGRFLMSVGSIGGIAMTENGDTIVSDQNSNEVFAVWDPGGAAIRQFLVGAPDGVSSPVGVAVSASNRIYIANAGSATIMTLDSSGRYLKTHDCACAVSGLYTVKDSVFRLTDRLDDTIFLIDASSVEERILFVPKPEDLQ